MEKGFLDKVEDNTTFQIWSEKMQQKKGDSLTEGYMSELWDFTRISAVAQIKQKGDIKCIPWKSLRTLILAHPDMKKRVDVFALSIYELVIFPKALGHIDDAVSDLFGQLDKRVMPIPAILDKTFKSLNACQKVGEGRFIGCAQLLLAWFHSYFWRVEKVSY
ncbi:hypothetical protein Golax_000972 [Gossypium laxum]|uniref:DUF7745 domain-containing protein n=1 Tax=Gossypium laxum TaxID=34288 RepID=A0A7J9AVD1_9ROSI|nr:hypothetical protein [Gossypium laxum]